MQITTPQFDARARASVRPIAGKVRISFAKAFSDSIEFFTLDSSALDSGDFLQGEGDVVQEWDKYAYDDYSGRLISMEWNRQEDPVSSVVLATADIELDNHDGYFTPGAGSAIDGYILPNRPIRLYAGFKDEVLPVFIGFTEKMPELDERAKTAKFHCIDFLQSLLNRPLEDTSLYQNVRTDEFLSELLLSVGLLPSQFILDVGLNLIPYAYASKGDKLGDIVDKLMAAEQGRLYMDENGMIRFKNRQNYQSTPVWYFDGSNVIESETLRFDDLVNVVEINARIRTEQELQKGWELSASRLIPAGQSVDVWGEFQDPVTTCDVPAYVDAAGTSYYATNENAAGTGAPLSGNISLTATALYATSFKMTFHNASAVDTYVTNIVLYATPAKVTGKTYVRQQDDASVAKYEEHVLPPIDNDFIGSAQDATSRALVLLQDYKEYNHVQGLTAKGNPALQPGDLVGVSLKSVGDYIITKLSGKLMNASLKQVITVKQFTRRTYFILDSSGLDLGFELAP